MLTVKRPTIIYTQAVFMCGEKREFNRVNYFTLPLARPLALKEEALTPQFR